MSRLSRTFVDEGMGSPEKHQYIEVVPTKKQEVRNRFLDFVDRNRKLVFGTLAAATLFGAMSLDRGLANDKDICLNVDAMDNGTLIYARNYLNSRGGHVRGIEDLRFVLQPVLDANENERSLLIPETELCTTDRKGWAGEILDNAVGTTVSINQ